MPSPPARRHYQPSPLELLSCQCPELRACHVHHSACLCRCGQRARGASVLLVLHRDLGLRRWKNGRWLKPPNSKVLSDVGSCREETFLAIGEAMRFMWKLRDMSKRPRPPTPLNSLHRQTPRKFFPYPSYPEPWKTFEEGFTADLPPQHPNPYTATRQALPSTENLTTTRENTKEAPKQHPVPPMRTLFATGLPLDHKHFVTKRLVRSGQASGMTSHVSTICRSFKRQAP